MIGEGMKVQFVPSFAQSKIDTPEEAWAKHVTGTIIFVNWEHRVFFVEYYAGDTRQVETFQFFDIGKSVKILGRK